jgi:hypothetical protein
MNKLQTQEEYSTPYDNNSLCKQQATDWQQRFTKILMTYLVVHSDLWHHDIKQQPMTTIPRQEGLNYNKYLDSKLKSLMVSFNVVILCFGIVTSVDCVLRCHHDVGCQTRTSSYAVRIWNHYLGCYLK